MTWGSNPIPGERYREVRIIWDGRGLSKRVVLRDDYKEHEVFSERVLIPAIVVWVLLSSLGIFSLLAFFAVVN